MKLECIDTFTGIGGIGLALQDLVTPVLYCEVNPFCQAVIMERMEEGKLERAPLHSDIQNLHVPSAFRPRAICGGFPCQDISCMGLQEGIIGGSRSNMFYHMMRLVDECPSIEVIFLENVGNIVRCGMQEVIEECVKRGFNLQWMIRSAGSMGAPHRRERWFCLACKSGVDLSQLKLDRPPLPTIWEREDNGPRVSIKPDVKPDDSFDTNWTLRCQALGNAVVPCVVREAFVDLVKKSRSWGEMSMLFSDYKQDLKDLSYPYPEAGLIYDHHFYPMPKGQSQDNTRELITTLSKGKSQTASGKSQTASGKSHTASGKSQTASGKSQTASGKETVTLKTLPTPRRGVIHASATLTDRTQSDLPTVLLHCHETRTYLEEQGLDLDGAKVTNLAVPNTNFVEWMMGYDKDWTKVSGYTKGRPTNKPSTEEQTIEPKKKKVNGMQLFMQENPGNGIKAITEMWKALSLEDRKGFSQRAKAGNIEAATVCHPLSDNTIISD
jgi:site-specific DNA-cytosine methylase